MAQNNSDPGNKRKLSVIGYVRCSTTEQAELGTSINNQKRLINDYVKLNSLKMVGWYADEGYSNDESAKETDPIKLLKRRPAMYRLYLDACQKKFDVIVFKHWDRFLKDKIEYGFLERTLSALGFEWGVDVKATHESNENIVIELKGGVSREESRKRKLRIKDGMEYRLSQNRVQNRANLGYKFNANKELVPDVNSDAVLTAFKLTSEGMKAEEICNQLIIKKKVKDRYVETNLAIGTLYRLLKNRIYLGYFSFRGQEYKGNFESIISIELFEKVQQVIKSRNITRLNYFKRK